MQNSLISIIVPNYNNELYLEECIESILNQTYKNIEIVIIDDYSSDKSKDIIKLYQEKYNFVTVIFNETNQGVTKNRDVAISKAKGYYITTLDSDDYYMDKQKIEKEIAILEKYKKNDQFNIISFSNIVLVNKEGKRLFPNAKNNIKEGNIFKNIFARDCMIPRDFIFTKEQYLDAGGFDINIPIYEDWDLKLRLAKNNQFFYSGLDGIGYRRHGAGLSSAEHSKHIKWLKYIYNKNKTLINKKDKYYIETELNKFMSKAFNSNIKTKLKTKIRRLLGLSNG
jgi:glycosyltransferase involved in cell wall biosynthesis